MMMDSGSRLFFNRSSSNLVFLGNSDPPFSGPKSVLTIGQDSYKKRPFFCSPDDYIDEEYYDEHLAEKKRRLTPEQVNMLEKSFEAENKLEPETKTQLARKLGLQPRQVAVWFQNRRARWKTKQLERDYDLLKASYDSLLSDHESILAQHDKLKSEVASLTEKLQAKEVEVDKEPEPLKADTPNVYPLQVSTAKAEDSRLSTGTAGSAVVDLDSPQLLDSGNSFFPNGNDYDVCAIHPEEDDGSDNGRGYFSDVFVEQQQHEVEEPLGWWMWS